jgi:hypothetical protein
MNLPDEFLTSTGQLSLNMETSQISTGLQSTQLTFFAEDSPVKTLALPAIVMDLKGGGPDCGPNLSEPFGHYDHGTSSWKTYQGCLLTLTWDEFSETWPRAGTMQNGIVYQHQPLADLTSEIEYTYWPTPQASDERMCVSSFGSCLRTLRATPELGTESGWLNPTFSEWLMGYPKNWTDLEDSGTPSSRK